MKGGVVETLSDLVSQANATIQLNALWGPMVSEGRRQEREEVGKMEEIKEGRKEGREEEE